MPSPTPSPPTRTPTDPWCSTSGPTPSNLLEVLAAIDEDGEEVAFHAMPIRPIYWRLLP